MIECFFPGVIKISIILVFTRGRSQKISLYQIKIYRDWLLFKIQ